MDRAAGHDTFGDDLIRSIDRRCPVSHVARIPGRHGVVGTPLAPVDPDLMVRLGIRNLWSHQAVALDHIRAGRSVVLTSGTGSGKSLSYQIPIVERILGGPTTSMLIFPTKALAHDQLASFTAPAFEGVRAATYDGDSDNDSRATARRQANVILTNPEMLHSGILPNHHQWARFLSRLHYVVIDELHLLRGVFGTNMAHLLRRLRRTARHHGSDPQFIFCSASLGRPEQLASQMAGLDVEAVTIDGAPRGERTFILCDPHERSPRLSSWKSAAAVTAALVESGHRTLAFGRSRKLVELMADEIRARVAEPDLVCSYRGGYLPTERREIESALDDGTLRAVATTSALELGIDIGLLDATVLAGFPGTISSLWQQAGRSGRSGREATNVLVAGDDQIDRWYVRNPEELFSRPPEEAVINPANRELQLPHLRCAAHEKPLTHHDEALWPDLDDGVLAMARDDSVWIRRRAGDPLAVWAGRETPHHGVGLRSGTGGRIRITHNGVLIGTADTGRACRDVHPGAVYLHRGRRFRVIELDLERREALVEPTDAMRSTQPRSETTLRVLEVDSTRPLGSIRLGLGTVEVERRVIGYTERDALTGESLGHRELDLPPHHLTTTGVWLQLTPTTIEAVEPAALPGSLHALEHAAIGLLPLFTICDRWDVGGVSTSHQVDLGCPAVVIYDAFPGGVGISELAAREAEALLRAAEGAIVGCDCTDGCPSCVHSPKCGSGNEPLDKGGAVHLLHRMLDDEVGERSA